MVRVNVGLPDGECQERRGRQRGVPLPSPYADVSRMARSPGGISQRLVFRRRLPLLFRNQLPDFAQTLLFVLLHLRERALLMTRPRLPLEERVTDDERKQQEHDPGRAVSGEVAPFVSDDSCKHFNQPSLSPRSMV